MRNVSPLQSGGKSCSRGRKSIPYVKVASWNIEGLTDIKIFEVCRYMRANRLSIVCLQETRRPNSDTFTTEDGYLVVLSGSACQTSEWAGVGFIVSPEFKNSIIGFCPWFSRIASTVFKINGFKHAVVCVYAPHNLKPVEEKLAFYDALGSALDKLSINGSKFIAGDLNARLGACRVGEESAIGEHCFGKEAVHPVPLPNRHLLIEFCSSRGYAVSNTFHANTPDRLVTFREHGTTPMAAVLDNKFAMLDLFLVPCNWLSAVEHVSSDRTVSFASQHFPVTASLRMETETRKTCHHGKPDWAALQIPGARSVFNAAVGRILEEEQAGNDCEQNLDMRWSFMKKAMEKSVETCIPAKGTVAKKPWISQRTLQLIEKRTRAHIDQDWRSEKKFRKEVHKSARADKSDWLENLVKVGDWKAVKRLRKGRRIQQCRLKNATGVTVLSSERPETLADHLERIQWKVRPVTELPEQRQPLRDPLPIKDGSFEHVELRKAINKLRSGKAYKQDDVPIECLKIFADTGGKRFQWLLDFCNRCWEQKTVPSDWSLAMVSMIFKKGDPSLCDNYRPICILTVACKVFAAMLKSRIVESGALQFLWESQFGFRPACSTEDAIYTARRHIELACAQRYGKIALLALDWKEAFDSVNVDALLLSLQRFDLTHAMVDMISALLRHRSFMVNDSGIVSSSRPQRSGISQGCTLSPLLFIIAMSVLMNDAVRSLSAEARAAYDRGDLADVVYADDTLLLGSSSEHLNEYLHCVARAGQTLGMELHWDKFQLLPVQCTPKLMAPDGSTIPVKNEMQYLGAALSGDGLCDNELSRRIGVSTGDFRALSKIWKHSSLPWRRKLHIYAMLIESKLLYGLSTVSFTVAQRRKLNGFQSRCLRQILGIKSAYESRVSNAAVLQKAGHPLATDLLAKRQLHLFGKVLRSNSCSPLKKVSFIPGTTTAATDRFVRRVGRPRKEWVREVRALACKHFGCMDSTENVKVVANPKAWKRAVNDALAQPKP